MRCGRRFAPNRMEIRYTIRCASLCSKKLEQEHNHHRAHTYIRTLYTNTSHTQYKYINSIQTCIKPRGRFHCTFSPHKTVVCPTCSDCENITTTATSVCTKMTMIMCFCFCSPAIVFRGKHINFPVARIHTQTCPYIRFTHSLRKSFLLISQASVEFQETLRSGSKHHNLLTNNDMPKDLLGEYVVFPWCVSVCVYFDNNHS